MKPSLFAEILLWLWVINLGIVFGAGVYEARIVVPIWRNGRPGRPLEPDTGRRFWGFVATIPLTLLCLSNGVIGSTAPIPLRSWWLSAASLGILERVLTFGYFIPTILKLQRADVSSGEFEMAISRWARWNHVRNLLTLLAWMAAMKLLCSLE